MLFWMDAFEKAEIRGRRQQTTIALFSPRDEGIYGPNQHCSERPLLVLEDQPHLSAFREMDQSRRIKANRLQKKKKKKRNCSQDAYPDKLDTQTKTKCIERKKKQ